MSAKEKADFNREMVEINKVGVDEEHVRYPLSNYVGIWREMHLEAHASENACVSRRMCLETHASPDASLVSLHSTPLSTPLSMEFLRRYITTTYSWHMAQNRENGSKVHLPPHC
jgi:hypothetical protein